MSALDWHALVALGTNGGQALADGDRLARGVHLLWAIRPELGVPAQGYHVWRRAHQPPEWVCLDSLDHLPLPPDATTWSWAGFRFEADPGPVRLDEFACGKLTGLHLPGADRVLTVLAGDRAVAVRATGGGPPPLVEVLAAVGDGTAVSARRPATATASGGWGVEAWGEGIVGVRFTGDDLRLCTLCFGLAVPGGGGWVRLHERPILLPVVPPGTANDAANVHAPAATRAEARARLSSTLAPEVRDRLAHDFADEPRALLELLLRDGREAALPADATAAAGARTPPRLGMSAASLVALAAVDPDVSRMLGLYWHDPVDGGRWDYRVVAHHGAVRYPGRRVTFAGLAAGRVAAPTLAVGGLTFVGTTGLEIVAGDPPSGGLPVLRVEAPRAGTLAGFRLERPAPALTLRFAGPQVVVVTAWRGSVPVDSAGAFVGQATVEHAPGIDAVTWATGPVSLHAVELHDEAGTVGDLVAHAWNVGPRRPPAVRALALDAAAGAAEPTRLLADGTVDRATGVAGIDWSDPDGARDVQRPVRVLVARAFRGDGEAPGTGGRFAVRNADLPAPAFARSAAPGPWPGPAVPRRWTERGLDPGWHAWRVRGIDAFGRLGAWSAERVAEVRPGAAPPPPDRVTARYLDPADPILSDEDRALADADGAGVLVEWTWPAARRLRAPLVEPAGEFRVYVRRGDPNRLAGEVRGVTDLGDRSRLETDLAWPDADALVGELARVDGASFEIAAHGTGTDVWLEVRHLASPTRRPGAGPLAIHLSEAGAAHADLASPLVFDRRAHAEPVGEPARVTTTVTGVAAAGDTATVTLADRLPAADGGALPGLLVSRGIAYPVLAQAPGSAQLEVRAATQPDGSPRLPEPGEPCTVWAGAAYRAWLPGLELRPAEREALATGLVAVSTADGDAGVTDHPAWSRPGRGALGGRPGREGPVSRVARLAVPHRGAPAAVPVARPPEQDGDVPADEAEPADWYGRARYTLDFPTVAGATGYRVLRASTAALFARDRALRQTGAPPYAAGPFDDGGASEAWLAEHHPAVSVADLTADLTTHPDAAAVLAAWRGWAAWHYPQRLNKEVMDLAELDGNREAFQPAHEGAIAGPPYRDTLDGRGSGRFVYRVRTVDASGNAGVWSAAFPLVLVRDVTPPATPTLVAAAGYDGVAWLCWRRGGEPDLTRYRIWRADDPAALAAVHRLAPHAEVALGDAAADTITWSEDGLPGLRAYHYRLAAVDAAGNASAPTATIAVRVTDSRPPAPPAWERAEWVMLHRSGREHALDDPIARGPDFRPAVALRCLAAEVVESATIERRARLERTWRPIATLGEPVDPTAPATSDDARRYAFHDDTASTAHAGTYRVRLRKRSGATNAAALVETTVGAAVPS